MIVALNTTEAKYIAIIQATKEALWFRKLQQNLALFIETQGPVIIKEDNQSAIVLAIKYQFHDRRKHIDIRHHYIRELVESKLVTLNYCNTDEMIADAFIKSLPRDKLDKFCKLMGLW